MNVNLLKEKGIKPLPPSSGVCTLGTVLKQSGGHHVLSMVLTANLCRGYLICMTRLEEKCSF